ncbi:hypothetical protein [Pseudofrankia asymbiotica]|nr:hypothetical protein [Pseudofrankia asymbiotica]
MRTLGAEAGEEDLVAVDHESGPRKVTVANVRGFAHVAVELV